MGWVRRIRRLPAWLGTVPGRFAVALAFVVILTAVAWPHLQPPAGQQAAVDASRIATMVVHDITQEVERLDRMLENVMGGRQSPADARFSQLERNAILADRVWPDRYIDFVDVLGPDGNVLASTRAGPEFGNWATRDYFNALRSARSNDPFIGEPYQITHDDKAALTVSRRLPDRDGQFAGVVVAGLRLSYFRDLFGGFELGPHDSVALVTTGGVILMRLPFDANDIGRRLEPAAPFHGFMRTGGSAVSLHDPADRIQRSYVFRRIGSLPLVVSVGMATEGGISWWLPALGAAYAGLIALLVRSWLGESRRRGKAERESREKSGFLTTLSHELRTPLHGVLGYAEHLLGERLATAHAEDVAKIVHAGRHMRDIVNLVLDYARVEAKGPLPHMRPTDIRHLVDDCMAIIEPAARARGLETQTTVSAQMPARFVTDAVQLRQILMNLLSNAVKYTPQGTVEIRLGGDDNHLKIEVADTGIGIPEARRHRLFDEYERFGAERTGIEGTGLGLAIAQRLAHRMGGDVGHRHNFGGGSVFWLVLPAGVAEDAEAAAEAEYDQAQPLRILLADDSEINRGVAAGHLRTAGHTVLEAADGGEAVDLAGEHLFDVVLMDMRMPGMDGLEATRRIRALKAPNGRVPIVAVTANALDAHAEECRRAGMSEHLAKPFNKAELLAAVTRAAAQARARPQNEGPAIDPATLGQVRSAVGEAEVQRLLDCLALRIEAMLRRLDEPSGASEEEIAPLAHELAGGAGTLGFGRLAAAARRFDTAAGSGFADQDQIRREAKAALCELRRRRSLEALLSV